MVACPICRLPVLFLVLGLISSSVAFQLTNGASTISSLFARRSPVANQYVCTTCMISASASVSTESKLSLEFGAASSSAQFHQALKQESAADKKGAIDSERLHAQLRLEWAEEKRQVVAAHVP